MAEQLGGGRRSKWEAVLRYITRPKAGVKLRLTLRRALVRLVPAEEVLSFVIGLRCAFSLCYAGCARREDRATLRSDLSAHRAIVRHRERPWFRPGLLHVIAGNAQSDKPERRLATQPLPFAFPAGALSRRLASASR